MYLAQYENKKIFDEAKTTPRSAVAYLCGARGKI